MQISEKQLYAFRAVCNAIVPSLSAEKDDLGYWNRTASDFQVAEKIIQVVATDRKSVV